MAEPVTTFTKRRAAGDPGSIRLLSFAFEEDPADARRWVERLEEAAHRLG